MAVISSKYIFGNVTDPAYDIAASLKPSLILDIGASDGHKAELMLKKSPNAHIIAAEPFPPNVKMLRQRLGDDPRVTIVDKAIANAPGTASFTVPSTVKEEKGERAKGYSSVGFLSDKVDDTAEQNITVEKVTVDGLIGDKNVTLMKIDVQGGELGVLVGAEKAITNHRIDIIYVEFSGSTALLDFLTSRGYIIFDTEYLIIPRAGADLSEWDLINPHPFILSDGNPAHHGWPKAMPSTQNEYIQMFKNQHANVGYTQTDLIAIAPKTLGRMILSK